jgi:signal transduction histidine kinase
LTPEAVIDRYLETALRQPLDAAAFVRMLGTDADLLSRWLQLLACPADPAAMMEALTGLGSEHFEALVVSQALAVLTVSGSARLSYDQWQSVLCSSVVAERLAAELSLPDPVAARWRMLLAASGVRLTHDDELAEILTFRGARTELLEDASIIHRLFAVIESLDVLDPLESQERAAALLKIPPERFQVLLADAEAQCAALQQQLGLTPDREFDSAEGLWLRLQVGMMGRVFATPEASTPAGLLAAHAQVSRRLFGRVPVLLLQDAGSGRLAVPGGDGPTISLASQSSAIARSVRLGERVELVDRADQSVADREMLRRLATGDAVCYPLRAGDATLGAVVFAVDEDIDQEALMGLYADELGRRLPRREAGVAADGVARFQRRAEKRLRELVHEANNPLSVVNNYLHILETTLEHEPQAVEHLRLIGRELNRVRDIIAQARELPPVDSEEVALAVDLNDVDLGALVHRIVVLHRAYAADHSVALLESSHGDRVSARSDEHRLAQVLNNLVRNAIEASAGATVTVGAASGVFRQGREGVLLEVADTGPGLPREVQSRLAEPKQSSKGGDHAGLGLHIVHRLVAELDGTIDVRTAAGQGTMFSIFLPRQELSP